MGASRITFARALVHTSADPDPQTTECGGEEYGRNIRGEKYVRTDQGKAPPRRGRQREAGGRKSNAKNRPRLGYSMPTAPKFLDQFHHASRSPRDQRILKAPSIGENTRRAATKATNPARHRGTQPAWACVVPAGWEYDETQYCSKMRRMTWDGWTARLR